MTLPTLRRSSAAAGNAKAKRYVLGVPNGTADLGDLRRRPCGPAHLGCAIRIRGHSASGTNTNTNAMSKDECANGEVAVTLCVFLNMPTLF